MNFYNTRTSLPITKAEEHKSANMKLEKGVRLSLEERQIEKRRRRITCGQIMKSRNSSLKRGRGGGVHTEEELRRTKI